MCAKPVGVKSIAVNKKVRHHYELLESFEAGLALQGVEVKSLRQGKVSFKDGYVDFKDDEAWLKGVHIAPYENAGYVTVNPERERKLLLHTYEIKRLTAKVEQKGLSVVPVKLYFKNGKVKLEIAIARGKKLHDKREDLKQRDIAKDTARQMARY